VEDSGESWERKRKEGLVESSSTLDPEHVHYQPGHISTLQGTLSDYTGTEIGEARLRARLRGTQRTVALDFPDSERTAISAV
ncbi:hypothetical protein IRJ41_015379, partial [Triplophysa rosa]